MKAPKTSPKNPDRKIASVRRQIAAAQRGERKILKGLEELTDELYRLQGRLASKRNHIAELAYELHDLKAQALDACYPDADEIYEA
jgi:chromosome segregation ATPase